MPKKKIKIGEPKKKFHLNLGNLAFFAVVILALANALLSTYSEMSFDQNIVTGIFGILGAVIAITNIQKKEEVNFMVSTVTLVLVVLAVNTVVEIPATILTFLANLITAFGIAGFIVALGMFLKLSWD